jgi:hypothetical protein
MQNLVVWMRTRARRWSLRAWLVTGGDNAGQSLRLAGGWKGDRM